MKTKDLFLMFLLMTIPYMAMPQGVTRYGQHISSSSYFVNKNGKISSVVALNKNGKTLALPTLAATTAVTSITAETGSSGGNVSNDGGATVTDRGVCWATTSTPTTANSKISTGSGTGSFTSAISGLNCFKTYYVRAYATNAAGTAYGTQVSFTTASVAIGNSYQGGIVGYILVSGDPGYLAGEQHGFIDGGEMGPSAWGCYGTDLAGATGTALGTGKQNTIDIVAGCSTAGISARVCSDLSLNGYSDWYLPSKDELNKLTINRASLVNFNVNILSSTEYGGKETIYAWFLLGILNGSPFWGGCQKDLPIKFRPIRSF
jgi:hypothetical protein